MRCHSCTVQVPKEFAFSIKSNTCPACGERMMSAQKLEVYDSIKDILQGVEFVEDKQDNIEAVAQAIVSSHNFGSSIKQPVIKELVTAPQNTDKDDVSMTTTTMEVKDNISDAIDKKIANSKKRTEKQAPARKINNNSARDIDGAVDGDDSYWEEDSNENLVDLDPDKVIGGLKDVGLEYFNIDDYNEVERMKRAAKTAQAMRGQTESAFRRG